MNDQAGSETFVTRLVHRTRLGASCFVSIWSPSPSDVLKLSPFGLALTTQAPCSCSFLSKQSANPKGLSSRMSEILRQPPPQSLLHHSSTICPFHPRTCLSASLRSCIGSNVTTTNHHGARIMRIGWRNGFVQGTDPTDLFHFFACLPTSRLPRPKTIELGICATWTYRQISSDGDRGTRLQLVRRRIYWA